MRLDRSLFFCVAFVLTGCVTIPPSAVPAPSNSRIGVLVLVDDQPKQLYRGATIFSHTERANVSNWKFVDSIHAHVVSVAEGVNGQTIVRLNPTSDLVKNRLNFVKFGWSEGRFNEDLSASVGELVADQKLNFILTVEPWEWPLPSQSNHIVHGYGVLSGCMLNFCFARGFANVISRVYALNPTRLVAWSITPPYEFSIHKDVAGDIENLSASEVDRVKLEVHGHVFTRIDSAIERSGLSMKPKKPSN